MSRQKIWLNTSDVHTLILGATRSGKSRKIILPSIWAIANAGESMVLGDPKGELFISSKEYLESMGYEVIALNIREPNKGNRWNMMQLVSEAVDNEDIPKATEAAWDIASAFSKQNPATTSEPIWQDGTESTLAALILLTALNSEYKEERHMTTCYNLLSELGSPDNYDRVPLIEYINKLPSRHPAKEAFAIASLAPYKMRATFFTTTLAQLKLFADPNICDMTCKQDHSLEDIGKKKTAVFLIIPDEKTTRNIFATLYVDQLYSSLVNLANSRGGRIPVPVNIILDEFGNLPAIPDFPTKLTVGGGRGIRFTIAVQDIQQIKKLYKENSQTITGNCHNWIYLKTADVETAKLISEKTGKYTVATDSSGSSIQTKSYSISQNVSYTGRPLLMPDEVLRWDSNYSLLLPVGNYPARFPLPDLVKYPANTAFGFVKPSGDIEYDKEENRKIIEERWNSIEDREIKDPPIWIPKIKEELAKQDEIMDESEEKEIINDAYNSFL